jgi:hypothetical protein
MVRSRSGCESSIQRLAWGPELAWARQAWRILETHGLADYSGEFERHTVAFRFLVLGGIYRDFCAVYWEEPTDHW